ncbi:MAG: hypothetical protein D6785_09220, partial [Planctomycetota bacterium]
AIIILNLLLPLLYFSAAFVYGKYFYRKADWAKNWKRRVLLFVVLIHLLETILRGLYYKGFPITSIYEAASLVAFALVLIYLYIEIQIQVDTTGYFILVFVFFLQLFSSALATLKASLPPIFKSSLFIFHTSFGILGYASLFISALYSFLYLMLFYDLKSSRFGIFYDRLPSLETLKEVNLHTARLGFLCFFLSILLGIGLTFQLKIGSFFDFKGMASLAALTLYGLEMVGEKLWNWSGKRLAFLNLFGFTMLLFSFLIVNFFLTSFHEFH